MNFLFLSILDELPLPLPLLIFVVLAVLLAIFCFAMAIISGILRATSNGQAKSYKKNNVSVAEKLDSVGFVVSKQYDADMVVMTTQVGKEGVNFSLIPRLSFFFDDVNKTLAIGTYSNNEIKYFNYKSIKAFELRDDVGVNGTKSFVRKLDIILRTDSVETPIYVVSIIKERLYTDTELYKSLAVFQQNVTNELNSIVDQNKAQ